MKKIIVCSLNFVRVYSVHRVLKARQTLEDDRILRLTSWVQENAKSASNAKANHEEVLPLRYS